MGRPRVLIMGKLPPPVMGPAVATKIILESDLNERFDLIHFDTRINKSVAEMGSFKLSKLSSVREKYRAFSEVLKKEKPHLVLVPIGQTTVGFFKDLPFIKMAAKAGAKVVIQLRGSAFRTWYDALNPILKWRVKSGLQKADAAIVLGENLKPIFQGLFSDDKIFVVPNGGDYNFPTRQSNHLQVLYLANYLPGKGLKELLEAMKILAKKNNLPQFQFQAHGNWDNPDYRQACERLAKEIPFCNLGEGVSGSDKWQAFANSDLFVFAPNAPEGHPWSIVEATAAGLPVIATDQGAIRQNVIDEQNGFLLDKPVPEELADRLERLLTNEELCKQMSQASRSLYEKEFTAVKMTQKLGAVFNALIHVAECVE